MINLEELTLYLSVLRFDSTYIDGIQLYDQFLIYMTQLKKFTFNIKTRIHSYNDKLELPTNEVIQRSFIGRGYQQVASYVDTIAWKCHIYSLRFGFEYFVQLDNSFPGGMFHKVRYLTMSDKHPFEHQFFQLISQDFPYLEYLDISNDHPQKDKQRSSTLLAFPYLTCLNLEYAHDDYIELFVLKNKTHLPRLLNLRMEYKSISRITNNFTDDATYFNFSTLKSLDVCQTFVRPKVFHEYFPLL